jgi:type IV pilus assembly protein PilF
VDLTDYNEAAVLNLQLGLQYMRNGRFDLAEDKLLKAISLDDRIPQAHNALGVLYTETERFGPALDEYRKAVALDSNFNLARINYGELLCRQGQVDAGEKQFNTVIRDYGGTGPANVYEGLGICRMAAGDPAAAEALFREALELEPRSVRSLLELADATLQQGEPIRARAFLQRYHASAPETPRSLLLGYRIEQIQGNPDASETYELRLRTDFPDSREAAELRMN